MGKINKTYFDPIQKTFLDHIASYPDILKQFYLTGGTALSACYLNHRYSEDIDLFSPDTLDEKFLVESIQSIAKAMHGSVSYTRIHDCLRFDISLARGKKLKVDMAQYAYKQLERPNIFGVIRVDSISDIAVNKLLAISQRVTSKDFVDLYYILKRYTIWDLRHGVEHKFHMEIEPFYLASLLKESDTLDALPRMKKKLTLEEVKRFFTLEAKKLASTMIKA